MPITTKTTGGRKFVQAKMSNAINYGGNTVSEKEETIKEKVSKAINPFLDNDGKIFNPYINYQKALENDSTSEKAKEFIRQATGLNTDLEQFSSENMTTGTNFANLKINSSDGVFKNSELMGIIKDVSSETGVPANVLLAVAQQETAGKWYDKVSDGTGYSYGYMMLYDNGVIADLKAKGQGALAEKAKSDPYTNVLVGAKYLKQNYDTYGNWQQAMTKYNGSGTAAQKYGSTVWNRANSKAYIDAGNQIMSATSINSSNKLVNAAKRYMGTPYVWGGSSASQGVDCSGFVYCALKDAGYNVGRTSAQGYRSYGKAVSKSAMQPGDLVFFGTNENASHIGIYIGNGQMIHSSGGSQNTASNPGKGVCITNVNYRNDFIEARRY